MLQFRRITTGGAFVPQIDGLRFIAIASVVLAHIYEPVAIGPILSWKLNPDLPKRGVELFFVISGFILGVPFASRFLNQGPKVDLKRYFLRRLTRLEPPYLINLFVMTLDNRFIAGRTWADIVPHLVASCVYMHNQVFGAFVNPINGVAWSLEVEVQFYILAPLLAWLFAIRNRIARRSVVVILMIAFGILGNRLFHRIYGRPSLLYYAAFFLAGFLLCDLYLTRGDWTPSWRWDVLAAAGWFLMCYLGRVQGHFWLPFVLVLLGVTAFRGHLSSMFLSHPVITAIGGMCYSIYLFHTLVGSLVMHFTRSWALKSHPWPNFFVQTILIVPLTLLFCGAFFLLVERPCMDRRWPQKLWARFRTWLGMLETAR